MIYKQMDILWVHTQNFRAARMYDLKSLEAADLLAC